MGTRKNDKHQLFTRTYTNQTTSWLMHSLNAFGAWTNHGQTWTHHGPDLGEATTFPLIVCFVDGHMTGIQMTFFLGLPKWESRNSQSWDSHDFGAHNFLYRPLIKMRSKEKL
jgi:hypothetical protein